MTENNVIDIKAGRSVFILDFRLLTLMQPRHLLQEMTVPTYIANDAYLVGGRGRERSQTVDSDNSTIRSTVDAEGPSMVLLTGPNYSGKSVYQKQVALAVYMAHIGSFVPAEFAVIGLTDKILTRITTRETVSKVQSAFMIDLQQIALALSQATRRSLIVIDEFGKGTDSCGMLTHNISVGRNQSAYRPANQIQTEPASQQACLNTSYHSVTPRQRYWQQHISTRSSSMVSCRRSPISHSLTWTCLSIRRANAVRATVPQKSHISTSKPLTRTYLVFSLFT